MSDVLQERYQILRVLGQGGQGTVYVCGDRRVPGQRWALKRIAMPGDAPDDPARLAFLRETRALSSLRHPGLPLLVDAFEEGGDCYLVLELIEGQTLSEYVRTQGPLPEATAFAVGRTVLGIICFLHELPTPIVYRDLKPDNCMRTPDGTLKLIDFGLVRPHTPDEMRTTIPSGSVGYAPPEQWDATCGTDPRSDLYAWGALVAFLLSGRHPALPHPLGRLDEARVHLSSRGRQLLEHCTREAVAERPASARVLCAQVDRHLASLTAPTAPERRATARPSTARQTLSPPAVLLGLATLACVTLTIGHLAASLPPPPAALSTRSTLSSLPTPESPQPSRTTKDTPSSLQRTPAPRDPLLVESLTAYQQGHYRIALERAKRVLTRQPTQIEALILRASCRTLLERPDAFHLPYICSMTGSDAFEGTSNLKSVHLGVCELNQKGGLRGLPVVIDLEDDASSSAEALRVSERLLRRAPRPRVVLGPATTQRVLAVAPLFNNAGVCLLTPTATSHKVWEAGPYIFGMADSTERRVEAMARWVARSGHRRVGLLVDPRLRISVETAEGFRSACARLDPDIHVSTLPDFQGTAPVFSASVTAAAADRLDLLFLCDYRAEVVVQLARALRPKRADISLCSLSIAFTSGLLEAGGSDLDGLVLCSNFHPDLEAPQMRAFKASYAATFGTLDMRQMALSGYDAVRLLGHVLPGTRDARQLASALRRVGTSDPPFQGVMGPFATGRRLDARPLCMVEVREGRYRLLLADVLGAGAGATPPAASPVPGAAAPPSPAPATGQTTSLTR